MVGWEDSEKLLLELGWRMSSTGSCLEGLFSVWCYWEKTEPLEGGAERKEVRFLRACLNMDIPASCLCFPATMKQALSITNSCYGILCSHRPKATGLGSHGLKQTKINILSFQVVCLTNFVTVLECQTDIVIFAEYSVQKCHSWTV